MSNLLTVAETAKRLKLSKGKVYRMTWSGELYSKHIGSSVRIPEECVRKLEQMPSGYVSVHESGVNDDLNN